MAADEKKETPKLTVWTQRDRETDQFVFVVDPADVSAINVPDVDAPGCIVILRSGVSIRFPWEGARRDEHVQSLINSMLGKGA